MVKFSERLIGDGQPCFIVFEAGPTHDGLESAKRLTTLAAEAGADAVKFQIIDPDRMVRDKDMLFSYEVLDPNSGTQQTVTERLYDLLSRRALAPNEWRELKAHSDELGLSFFATVGFRDELDLLVEMGCHSVKIASGDVNHTPLIRQAARTGMCIQLDTGNATIGEIESAVDVVRSEGNEELIIHQCPSGYPARLESINLRIITTLKRMFPFPIAYSDHTPGWDMDIAAVALGANLVEKTITEDRTTRSVEHIFSLEPGQMRQFVKVIRDLETALGLSRRILHPEERKKRLALRRSAVLVSEAPPGTKLGALKVQFSRPGDGIQPDVFETLAYRTTRTALPAGHKLDFADIDQTGNGDMTPSVVPESTGQITERNPRTS